MRISDWSSDVCSSDLVAPDEPAARRSTASAPGPRPFGGKLFALSLTAICWGLVNFGLLLWLPIELIARGYSMEVASRLLAASALIALPTVSVVAWLYSAWRDRKSVVSGKSVLVRVDFGGGRIFKK